MKFLQSIESIPRNVILNCSKILIALYETMIGKNIDSLNGRQNLHKLTDLVHLLSIFKGYMDLLLAGA
ncbi:MAG: hypothetical protein ACJAT2_002289 [Bacteriovoracaceae bacterium]|jgi:hypothetical protein